MRARVPLLVLLAPVLLAASPLIISDADPALQELFDDGTPTKTFAKASKHLIMPEDYKFIDLADLPLDYHEDYDDIRSESKRSGLRAAMVAKGGRGVLMRPGWQIGGDPMMAESENMGGLISRRSQPAASPYLSVGEYLGVLSNVEQYFNGLREQLESMADQPSVIQNTHSHHGILREGPRPSATAAYLHALRSHRPSHRVRSFVEDPGPVELRGANSHDPALLWAGLGRR